MFLKSLEVRGFKSFADKTELRFKPGVTAVVGPNGSGKSNISDAVRWVLGEQSIKTLRGGKMEDVIFSGTQYRKPLGLAQVSLTLDNSDGGLQTEYNEVVVSRRIFRSGESEYLINNTKCRLKDITNLFLDTGIGKEGYSLIGQGKIEAILSGKTEDRRGLLEEAAGIVKYKVRKNESERKLQNTDDNLIRIRDIIATYEERLEPLRVECEKAIKFNDLSGNLKEKEVSLILHNIKLLEEELKKFNEDIKDRESSLNKKREDLQREREKLKIIEEKLETLESDTTEKKLEYYTKKEGITKSKSDIQLFNERIKHFNDVLEKNKYEQYNISSKLKEIDKEKSSLLKELENKKKEIDEKKIEISKVEEANSVLLKKLSEIQDEITSIQKSRFEILKGNSEVNNKITKIRAELKSSFEGKERIEKNIAIILNNIGINKSTINSLNLSVKSSEENLEKLREEAILKKNNLKDINTKITKKETDLRGLSINISKLEANKTMLKDLENQYEGYNRSLKNLMDRVYRGLIKGCSGIKVLGEVFEVSKEYEKAIETTLGRAISNVITEDDILAKRLVNYLKSERLGRLTFLPLNIINGKKLALDNRVVNTDGYIGIGSEIVSFDEKYRKVIDYALGRTIIAKDMDSAFKIAKLTSYKFKIVTLEGEVLNSGGALTGGSIKGKTSSILSRKREIEEIKEKLEGLNETLLLLEEEIKSLKKGRKKLDEDILNLTDKAHGLKIELATNKNKLLNVKNELDNLNKGLNKETIEKNNVLEKIDTLNKELKKTENSLLEFDIINTSNKEREVELQKLFIKEKEASELLKSNLTELRIENASLDGNLKSIKEELNRKDREKEECDEKELKLSEENDISLKGIEESKSNVKIKEDEIISFNKRIEELDIIFKEDEVRKISLKDDFKKIDGIINDIREIITKEEFELSKREINKAKCDVEKDNHLKKLNEELELTIAEAEELAIEITDLTKFKEEITSIKRRISALGTVNLASIEEYEEVKEKYEFMSSEEEDLKKAKEDLEKVIEEMTSTMRKLFKENFKIINSNFKETFKELFKGGNAELILGEGDELTSEIHINVEPPGKKLQNINLMSGGEKVLSAIALLFAILKMKPTPFCILDEIEAALDDANVYRYAEFLKKFSNNSQFIVITHRKGTMEVSDVMYGVTMEEKGVSKIVSVDLNK